MANRAKHDVLAMHMQQDRQAVRRLPVMERPRHGGFVMHIQLDRQVFGDLPVRDGIKA